MRNLIRIFLLSLVVGCGGGGGDDNPDTGSGTTPDVEDVVVPNETKDLLIEETFSGQTFKRFLLDVSKGGICKIVVYKNHYIEDGIYNFDKKNILIESKSSDCSYKGNINLPLHINSVYIRYILDNGTTTEEEIFI